MKVSRKMKIISIGVILLIGVGAIACANLTNNDVTSSVTITPQTTAKWQKKAPKLFSNAGYSKLVESSSNIHKNISESQAELIGTITNPFGIRDDILDYILKNVPNDNNLTLRAAVKSAQDNQLIYYGNITQEEAIKLADNDVLVSTCLQIYTGNQVLTSNIDKLMRNTKSREEHMWDIDTKYFGWKIIGSGLSINDAKTACAKGAF